MKHITTLILLSISLLGFSQQQVYVEVTDTVKIAYDIRFDGWEQEGYFFSQKEVRDSVGLDSIRIYKFYYLTPSYGTYMFQDTIPVRMAEPKKIYMPFEYEENITVPKGKDYRFSNY